MPGNLDWKALGDVGVDWLWAVGGRTGWDCSTGEEMVENEEIRDEMTSGEAGWIRALLADEIRAFGEGKELRRA